MANLPSVPDYLAGYAPQQSDMQSLWTGPLTFFQRRVVFRASQSSTSTLVPASPSGDVPIAYDTVLEDPYGGWSSPYWSCPSGLSGWYQITVTAALAPPGTRGVLLYGGAGVSASFGGGTAPTLASAPIPGTGTGIVSGSGYFYMAGGQDSCYGWVNCANLPAEGSTSVTAGQNSLIQVNWIST